MYKSFVTTKGLGRSVGITVPASPMLSKTLYVAPLLPRTFRVYMSTLPKVRIAVYGIDNPGEEE